MAPLGSGGGSAGLSVVDQSVAGEQLPVCPQLQPIFCRKRSTARRHRRELARSLPDLSLPPLAPRWLGSSLSGGHSDCVRSGHLAQSWRFRRSAGQGTTLRSCLGSLESPAGSCTVESRPASSRNAGQSRPVQVWRVQGGTVKPSLVRGPHTFREPSGWGPARTGWPEPRSARIVSHQDERSWHLR